MDKEIETQVLDVDKDAIARKLRQLGAEEVPEVLQRRWVFDLKPCNVNSAGEWIRLRQAGNNKPTITYKNKSGSGLSETDELEVAVDDFDKSATILSKLPFKKILYQENKRCQFNLNNIEYTLDTWPGIPTYLEIEAKSEAKIKEGLELLGLLGKDAGHLGTMTIYNKYGIDLHSYSEVKFETFAATKLI